MILKDIIKNYYDHKYITFFNIVFSIILSFFLYINLDRLTARTAYIVILDFNKSFMIPSELRINLNQYSFDGIENVFNDNLTSYLNFIKWADLNKININELNYSDFISLKLLDKKIIISDANINFSPIIIELLKEYIEFTIQKTNFEQSKKLFYLVESARLELLCGKIFTLLQLQSSSLKSSNLENNDLGQALEKTLEKYQSICLGPLNNDSNDSKLNTLDSNFNNYYLNSSSEIQIYNFVKLAFLQKLKASINNLKVINLPSITIIILVLSLILQNLLITFYKKDK